MQKSEYKARINHFIRAPRVKLIGADGTVIGEMPTYEALKMAKEQGLDLIEVNGKVFPVIVKLADAGKLKYEEKKRQAEMKKNQKISLLKEIYLHCTTDTHDVDRLVRQAKDFLAEGHRVRLTIKFRGRELSHLEVGREKLEYMLEGLAEAISEHSPIGMEGKNMNTTLMPAKTK